MLRCVIYARVSTARQAEQKISIPDQIARAKRYAKTRNMEVVGEFIDPGASGRDDKRPQFQAMIDSAMENAKRFDVILVHSFSRFFRDGIHFEVYRRKLEKRKIDLISITQEMSDGPGGEITRRVIALMDEMRSKEDAKHVHRGMTENARQGFWNGAPAPFGYKTVEAERRGDKIKRKLAIDPKNAEIVRLIFHLFLEGDGQTGPLGVKNIAQWLNARGHKSPRGGQYYTSRVYAILTNETYTGTAWFNRMNSRTRELRPREEWVKVPVPAIIPDETFQRTQILLSDKRPDKTPPRLSNSNVLLTGLVLCEGCGRPLMMTTGKGGAYRYYKCSGKHLKGKCQGDLAISIREEKLDELIMEALMDRLLSPQRTQAIVAEIAKRRNCGKAEASHALHHLRGQLSQASKRVNNLLNAIAEGVAKDTDSFRNMLSKAESEREELLRLIANQEAQLKEAPKPITLEEAKVASAKLKQLLSNAPADLKKRYVRAFVSEIVVGSDEIIVSGPKDALAEAISGTPPAYIAAASGPVRSLVREWRTRQDSNL